ncbi:hypothetical protein AQUCO_00400313v1 [Aquilegia coerulea]|uniref:Uncharacterized protein n=1 Tax=Aquilegia coerulea TaxID=218851 RepID=A0A2G5EUC1_AQUCA|nr:hypothetical protein AQUCO_00400313v1 [Aquilegia coerulea]PIA59323.1 hypothetical protein AQUCO_00400313v1 [Aquilegia coerulea]PIA59324.1 hypothetical protein AQUCO_00400313v1 [Aquilegia coerulea]
MKLNINILFIVVQVAGIFAAAAAADVRADHPLGHKRAGVQSLAPMSAADLILAAANVNLLASRGAHQDACHYNAPYGCSDGYCWKSCGPRGSGQWCWLAANNGVGAWIKCTTFHQCNLNLNFGCGKNCKQGSKACGCSC